MAGYNFLEELFGMTRPGQRMRQNEREQLADEFELLSTNKDPEQRNKMWAGIQQSKQFGELQERMAKMQGKAPSIQSPREIAENEGIANLTPEEKTNLVKNRGRLISEEQKKLTDAKIIKEILGGLNKTINPEIIAAGEANVMELLTGNKAPTPEQQDETRRKRRINSPAAKAARQRKETVQRLFTDGTNPFAAEPTTPPASRITPEMVTQLDAYLQGPTYVSKTDTRPRTYDEMGVDTREAKQLLKELQEAMPDVDVRQEYQDDPEGTKRIMELFKQGKYTLKQLEALFVSLKGKARTTLGIA